MDNLILKLRGMSCAPCASNIEKAIQSVPGVSTCLVNFGSKQAAVQYNSIFTPSPSPNKGRFLTF